jgi:hypothetical protein
MQERRGHQAVQLALGDARRPQGEPPFQVPQRNLQNEGQHVDRDQRIGDHRRRRPLPPSKLRPRLPDAPGA